MTIRRVYVVLGQHALFIIGTDRAIKRWVARLDPPAPLPVERPSPYSPAWRRLPLDLRRRLL